MLFRSMIVDEIAKLASLEKGSMNMGLEMEPQKRPSIKEVSTFAIQNTGSWMTPIISFLQDSHLPQHDKEARKVRKRAAKFTILDDTLYKKGFSMPYLKRVDEEEAKYVLEEIYEGVCGDHAGPRSLVCNILFLAYNAG